MRMRVYRTAEHRAADPVSFSTAMAAFHRVVLSPVLLLVIISGACWAANPGFRTALTNKALNYACSVGIPILEKELATLTIPDVSGDADTPIGHISYSLTNIKLTTFQIPTSSLTSTTAGLTVMASGISVDITADWSYREDSWPHIKDSGSCDISVTSVSLQVTVVIGADSKGHATLSCTTCSLNIGSLDIHFSGGASWLYNLFSSYIADSLKSSIQSQVCTAAKSSIDTQGNAALESLPVIVTIDSTSEIDYSLLQSPIFTAEYIETQHKGEFYDISHPVEAPYTPPLLPKITETSKMLYIWLTDYIADTAGFVYQRAGVLQYNVTPDMVPPSSPFQLNTSSFRALIPELYKMFPNWAMELDMNATKPPDMTFSSAGGNLTVTGEMMVEVMNPKNKTTQEAFTLGMTVFADAMVAIHEDSSGSEIITFNATFLRVELSLIHSNVGKFNVTILQTAANLVCTLFIIPIINKYGGAGLPIPTADGVSLVEPAISFGQDYVLVSSDFNYNPSKLYTRGLSNHN